MACRQSWSGAKSVPEDALQFVAQKKLTSGVTRATGARGVTTMELTNAIVIVGREVQGEETNG